MFAIVAGCGRLGSGLARALSSQGDDVVVVDPEIDPRKLGGDFDGMTVAGSPVDEETLEEAGIRRADLFLAATADDRLNAMAAQIAREAFGVPAVLARISDPALEEFYRGLGLDTVCPTSTAINQILDRVRDRSFSQLRGLIDAGVVGIRPPREWIGVALRDIVAPKGKAVAGVLNASSEAVSDPDRPVTKDDIVILRRLPRGEGRP